jgi:hypothetical protein
MNDMFGTEIQVGDKITHLTTGRSAYMITCIVKGFTPQKVITEYENWRGEDYPPEVHRIQPDKCFITNNDDRFQIGLKYI